MKILTVFQQQIIYIYIISKQTDNEEKIVKFELRLVDSFKFMQKDFTNPEDFTNLSTVW